MRWAARLVGAARTHARLFTIVGAAVAFTALLLVPADGGASGDTLRSWQTAGRATPIFHGNGVSPAGQPFAGVAAVGALFSESSGRLGGHCCTASVVHSPHGDLAVTAAHCVTGASGQIVFVPGYANGAEPFGTWQVTRVYTDPAWQSAQDPDDDVAFLRLTGTDGVPIEDVTGAEQVGTGWRANTLVRVIGYPDSAGQPVWCANWTKAFSPTQLEFDCGGYTNGTSGGPFLANVSASSGQGTVIGVIGGYQQGGDTPDVSYSSAFGPAVAALYQDAEAGG